MLVRRIIVMYIFKWHTFNFETIIMFDFETIMTILLSNNIVMCLYLKVEIKSTRKCKKADEDEKNKSDKEEDNINGETEK